MPPGRMEYKPLSVHKGLTAEGPCIGRLGRKEGGGGVLPDISVTSLSCQGCSWLPTKMQVMLGT